MAIPFDRLGRLFDLLSAGFYPERARRHIRRFIRTIPPAGVVVDLGGGTGTLLNFAYAARADLFYICADPSLGMLKHVRPHAYRVAARGEHLPFKEGLVAAVMIGDAFHHFTDPEGAVEEVCRVLKAGGALFFFDIDPGTLLGWLVRALERLLGEPGNFSSPGQLGEALVEKGFALPTPPVHGFRYTLEASRK